MATQPQSSDAEPPAEGLTVWRLIRIHALAASLVVIEFLLMQVIAILITTAVHWQLPLVEPGIERNVNHWMRIFQITSPTMTLSGGVAIVLSSYVLSIPLRHQVQEERRRADAAEQKLREIVSQLETQRLANAEERAARAEQDRAAAEQRAAVEQQRAAAAEAAIGELRAELAELRAELAVRGPARRRRTLR